MKTFTLASGNVTATFTADGGTVTIRYATGTRSTFSQVLSPYDARREWSRLKYAGYKQVEPATPLSK